MGLSLFFVMDMIASLASYSYSEHIPTNSIYQNQILWGWQACTFSNIARLFLVIVEIILCSISFLLGSVTQVKIEGSGKKMLLQEVIKKIKTQKKTFILFPTKIANSSRSDIDMFVL